jgi:cytochrome c oxidase assembly protein subunit 11
MSETATPERQRKLRRTGIICATVALGMVGAAFASVPLYRIFCQATGYGGTTQRADRGADHVLDRTITIRFDGNVASGLAWKFTPPPPVTLKVGATGEAHFRAENRAGLPSTGQAVFNVTPEQAGIYFNKIACFCFTEQKLLGGESIDMPVVFFVDPDMAKDRAMDHVDTITLSYTFYPLAEKAKPVTASAEPSKKL